MPDTSSQIVISLHPPWYVRVLLILAGCFCGSTIGFSIPKHQRTIHVPNRSAPSGGLMIERHTPRSTTRGRNSAWVSQLRIRNEISTIQRRVTGGDEDGVYVPSDDDNVIDDAYLTNVPSRAKDPSSIEETVEEYRYDATPRKTQTRNNVPNLRGEYHGRGGRGRGGRGRGRGRGNRGGRGRGSRGGRGDSGLEAAKALNKDIVQCDTPQDIFNIFASNGGAKGLAGGGTFNSVNFSTSLHRLARIATAYHAEGAAAQAETRRSVLADPRFAILVCSLAEAFVGVEPNQNSGSPELAGPHRAQKVKRISDGQGKISTFTSREISNTAWAIAKLNFAPPDSVFPLHVTRSSAQFDEEKLSSEEIKHYSVKTREEMANDLIETTLKIRSQVLEVAKQRSATEDPAMRAQIKSLWIPTLSQLGGMLLDVIATFALDSLHTFNSQEVANLLYSFATSGRADVNLFNKLGQRLMQVTNGKPQELSNSAWAFATAGIIGPYQRVMLTHVATSLEDGNFCAQFKPQELANTAWASSTLRAKRGPTVESDPSFQEEDDAVVRILRTVATSLRDRVDDFKPQEISNTLWAMATVGFGADEDKKRHQNEYIYLTSEFEDDDRALASDTLEVIASNVIHRLNRFRGQELNNMAWAYARLGHRGAIVDELFYAIGQQLVKRVHQFTAQDVGTCLWSMATVGYFDEEVYKIGASRVNRRYGRSFKPQECSNVCWALATAGMTPKYKHVFDTTLVHASRRPSFDDIIDDPITECFFTTAGEIMKRPYEFKEQELKDILWSFSRCELRHPRLFKFVVDHLIGADETEEGRGLEGFSTQGLGNIGWSISKQAQLSSTVPVGHRLHVGSAGRQAVYETSCLDLGETQVNRLYSAIAEEALNGRGGIDRFSPQDLSNTCWSMASLGLLHQEYFEQIQKTVIKRLTAHMSANANADYLHIMFKGQEVANLLWSFATLNVPAPEMIKVVADYVVAICRSERDTSFSTAKIAAVFKRQELANMAWSLAVLEQYPPDIITLSYEGLFGGSDIDSVESLNRLYQDGGLQKEQIMTMFYVQMALDMEASHLGLVLPDGFPNTYASPSAVISTSTNMDDEDDKDGSGSLLSLTSSRLQLDISETLKRIEFDHVLEHIIGSKDIFSIHNPDLDTSSFPEEFLSIDMANIEEKIGIEVDGPAHFINALDADSSNSNSATPPIAIQTPIRGGKKITKGNKVVWSFDNEGRRKVNGPTAFKHRLLCHLGWCIIHCPYWEWQELNGDTASQETYTKELLDEVF